MDKDVAFTEEDNLRIESATLATVEKLQNIVRTDGVATCIAEAIGISMGIAHVFKNLGLKHVHRIIRKDTARYISEG